MIEKKAVKFLLDSLMILNRAVSELLPLKEGTERIKETEPPADVLFKRFGFYLRDAALKMCSDPAFPLYYPDAVCSLARFELMNGMELFFDITDLDILANGFLYLTIYASVFIPFHHIKRIDIYEQLDLFEEIMADMERRYVKTLWINNE